jgi:seryl-tRNA synthetase
MILHIKLPKVLDKKLASELEKESAYISSQILKFEVNAGGSAVEIEIEPDASEQELRGKVERYLQAMLSRFPDIETKVYFRHERQNSTPLTGNIYEELQDRGWLFEIGPGHIGLTGPALALMYKVDATFTKLYRQQLGAVDRLYPALIKADLLLKCGYFDSHPNLVSLVTHVIDDFDAIEDFRRANEEKEELCIPDPQLLATPHLCLNPAACFPCYPSFEGRTIPAEGCMLTWMGRVFRYESKNIKGLDRLWEFNQRALVFMGNPEFISTTRLQILQLMTAQIAEWDLECQIESASDTFFATVATAKMFYEQSLETKVEVRLTIDRDPDGTPQTIAAGSINLHQNFFGVRFNITADDGQPAISGCAGMGLERWVLAIFAQHGFDPLLWPESLRAGVFQ